MDERSAFSCWAGISKRAPRVTGEPNQRQLRANIASKMNTKIRLLIMDLPLVTVTMDL